MAVRMVKIVNANGRIATVPATFPPLVRGEVRVAPSERGDGEAPVNLTPAVGAAITDDPDSESGFGPSGDEADHYDSGEFVAEDEE